MIGLVCIGHCAAKTQRPSPFSAVRGGGVEALPKLLWEDLLFFVKKNAQINVGLLVCPM